MYSPLTDQWDTAIRTAPVFKTVVDIYYAATTLPAISGLEISEWDVKIDRQAAIRRSGTVLISNQELFDRWTKSHPFEPHLSEVVIRSGLVYADGSEELIPLGRFKVEDISWAEPDFSLRITLSDRSRALQRHLWAYPVSRGGYTVSSSILDIINFTTPEAALTFDPIIVDVFLPGGTTYRGDNLSVVQEMAGAIAGEIYYDVFGDVSVNPVPFIDPETFTSQYNWKIDAGETGVMVSADRSISRTDTHNWVVVNGAPPTSGAIQPYAVAYDNNPESPTYYWGPFGKSEKVIDRQELTTYDQCVPVVQAEYRKTIGLAKKLSLKSLMNPALDAGDVIRVEYPDGSVELHLIDSMAMDQSGGMSLSTRSQGA